MLRSDKASVQHSDFHEVLAVIPTLGLDLNRLEAVIRSVRQYSSFHNYYLVVVDNSQHGNLGEIQGVDQIIRCGLNLGWVGSLEVVRRSFQFKYLWTLQDDMVLLNDVLHPLKLDLDLHAKRGVCGAVAIENGVIPAYSMGNVMENMKSQEWSSFPKSPTPPSEVEIPTNLCSVYGRGALWRGEALSAAGGFNMKLYPVHHVDDDMCLSLLRQGWTLTISSEAHVEHQGRGSTNTLLSDTLRSINTKLVREKLTGANIDRDAKEIDIDQDILFEIAAKSSYLVLEVSRLGSERLAQWQSRPWLSALFQSKLFRNVCKRYLKGLNSPNALERKLLAATAHRLKTLLRMQEK